LHGGPGGGAVNDLSTLVHILFDEHGDTREVVTFD
jgi:hypothetical protein